jgi:hypothetical protein
MKSYFEKIVPAGAALLVAKTVKASRTNSSMQRWVRQNTSKLIGFEMVQFFEEIDWKLLTLKPLLCYVGQSFS